MRVMVLVAFTFATRDQAPRVSPLELGPRVGWLLKWRVSGLNKAEVAKIA